MSGPDRDVAAGQVWRHYRGHAYFVLAVAQHTETNEQLVVYRRTDAHDVWCRPLAMFLSPVPDDPGAKRFVRWR